MTISPGHRFEATQALRRVLVTVETAFVATDLRAVLHLARDATDRVPRVQLESRRTLGAQQARTLVLQLADDHPVQFSSTIATRNSGRAFDEIFRTEGIKVIRTPIQAPNANAHAERWVRTLRADCLDRILFLGRRHRGARPSRLSPA